MTIPAIFHQIRQLPWVVCSCCHSEYSQMAKNTVELMLRKVTEVDHMIKHHVSVWTLKPDIQRTSLKSIPVEKKDVFETEQVKKLINSKQSR